MFLKHPPNVLPSQETARTKRLFLVWRW